MAWRSGVGRYRYHREDLLFGGEMAWHIDALSKMPETCGNDERGVFHPCGRSISGRLNANGRGRVDSSIEELHATDKLRTGRCDAMRSIGQLRAGR